MEFIVKLFGVSKATTPITDPEQIKRQYNRLRWSVFLSATIGYGLYYVCRLSLNVVKKPIVDAGILSESELGIIGSALFITYAIGKLTNGFLADRSNIRRFISLGLLISALANLIMGFTSSFLVFIIMWAVNGWFQSMGAAPSVVALSRWFSNKERGTYYGFWSSSHNIGEAITFILTAFIVSSFGWEWGFKGAALIGFLGVAILWVFMRDTPASNGLPAIAVYKGEPRDDVQATQKSIGEYQKEVLKNPAIWILAISSAFMYISRYAVNSWGIFYLEAEKGYSTIEASSIIAISSVCGILGTVSCGWISDKFFAGKRTFPALIFGIMNIAGLSLFLLLPKNQIIDSTAMVLFGLAIGALICYLGGLMAVDVSSKNASGAALGIIGIASYIGAALQDLVSGFTIEKSRTVIDGVTCYDFSVVKWFWIGSAILSALLATLVWNAKPRE